MAAPPRSETFELGRAATALLVLVFIAVGHLWSIRTGLFLDDHAHYAHLREAPWTIRGFVEASRLGIVGDVMDLWGRHEAGLRFFRPVAFAVMKLEYTLVHWRPIGMHLLSLTWHFIAAMLVGELAFRCFGRRSWAAVAAILMAIHPGHVATVYWIACQTELITTTFLLAGILAYARYADWPRPFFLQPAAPMTPGLPFSPSSALHFSPAPKRAGTFLCALLTLLCYALALGCRENAVLFPVICWAGDRLLVPREHRRVRVVPFLMIAVLGVYFLMRWHYLAGFPMPARPYIYPPTDPGFAKFLVEKIVYYTIGLFGFVPVIPMGGQAYFASHPAAFYGGFLSSLAILIIIWAAYRFRLPLLWPVLWTACTIAPVLPVFASSHHLYLPSVGAVLLLTAGLAALGGLTRPPFLTLGGLTSPPPLNKGGPGGVRPSERIPRPQLIVCAIVLALHAVGLGLFTWAQGFAYRAGTITEDIVLDEILRRSTPIRDGDHFFFINMPVLAYYAMPALETELGWNTSPPSQGGARGGLNNEDAPQEPSRVEPSPRKLHGHVLTFSPWLMRMESPGSVEVLDGHRLRVRSPENARYFEGVTGRTLLLAMGFDGTLKQGTPIRDDQSGFTVTPTQVDDRGVRELIFQFDRPLDSPGYHFLFGSPQFLAYPLSLH